MMDDGFPALFRFIFLGIYSLEMVIRVVAKGFILNNYTYLRSPWNWLDFLVIFSGYLTSFIEMGNLAGLRTFRVLRALKTISILPSKSFFNIVPVTYLRKLFYYFLSLGKFFFPDVFGRVLLEKGGRGLDKRFSSKN